MKTRLFLVGAPRSGTSMLLDLITGQPEFSWVSNKLDQKPEKLSLTRKNRKLDWPLLGEYWFERRYAVKHVPYPADTLKFWEHWLPGFKVDENQPRVPGPDNVTQAEAEACRKAVEEIQIEQGKDWFVAQYSGFSRVSLLRKVFPEAKFIQMQRDPRSVAMRLASDFDKHPERGLWSKRDEWKALMPAELQARLDDLPDTALNYAGVLVRWWHELYREELVALPETDRISLAYADLLSKLEKTMRRAVKFLGLQESKRMRRYIRFHQIQENNKRLNKDLPDDQAAQLDRAVKKVA